MSLFKQVGRALRSLGSSTAAQLKGITSTRALDGFKWPLDAVRWRRSRHGTDASVVMAPVLTLARAIPEAPITVVEKGEQGQEDQHALHDLARLVRRPNPYTSDVNLWLATVLDFLLDGNAYWIKVRDDLGAVVELWWAPHWLVQPRRIPGSGSFVDEYMYSPESGTNVRLHPDDVIHFRYGFDSADTTRGMSPLRSVIQEIAGDQDASNMTAALMSNMGIPGMIVSPDTDQPIDSDDADATKAYLEDNFTGSNRGRPLVLKGKTRVHTLGWSPHDMNLRELRRVPEERICAVLGVPAIIAGLGAGLDRATYSNYREARVALYTQAVFTFHRLFAAELGAQLLPEMEPDPERFEVKFDTSGIRELQEDEENKAQKWSTLVQAGIAQRGEARAAFGLEALDSDRVYLQAISVVERPAGAPPIEPGTEQRQRHRKVSRAQGEGLVRSLETARLRMADLMADELQAAFETWGDEVTEAFRQMSPDLNSSNGDGETKDRDEGIVDRVMQAVAVERFRSTSLRPTMERGYQRTAQTTVETINTVLDLGIRLPDPVMRQVIELGGTRAGLVDIDTETRRALFAALRDARAEGLGPPDAARRIRRYVPAGQFVYAGSRYRSELIARTETKYAQNRSSLEAYQQSDAIVGLRAYDNRIGHDDDDCIERDGRILDFSEAEAEMEMEHPNGTLSFAPVTRDEMANA